MRWNPYLTFDGNCEAAFTFYEKVLGGKIVAMMRFGETPAAEFVPAEHRNGIMHAALLVGDQTLMGSDTTPEHPYEGVTGSTVALHVETPAEAESVFAALSEGGTITMPLDETFWAQRFGMFTDKFGVPWLVNCAPPMCGEG